MIANDVLAALAFHGVYDDVLAARTDQILVNVIVWQEGIELIWVGHWITNDVGQAESEDWLSFFKTVVYPILYIWSHKLAKCAHVVAPRS